MKNIVVITGGAGGMGLATAKILGRENHVVISDISQPKLDRATDDLKQLDIRCDSIACDIADRKSVDALVSAVSGMGPVKSVIHTAGISPQMADPETILKINALGTVNIAEAFFSVADEGFALVNVASMAAYLFPAWLVPKKAYNNALSSPDIFLRKALFRCRLMPNALYRTGMAYSISKNFVIWYSKKSAAKFGQKGARILSVSPGTFDTDMGRLEEKSGSMEMLKDAALKRAGTPEEIAELLAFCSSEKASYLTGIDILCDGGVVASRV